MKNNLKLKFLLMALFGMMIGAIIVIAITQSASNPDLMYFVAASVVTLIILAFTWNIDKRSNDKINGKIDKIIEKLGIEGIDELPKKDKEVTKQDYHNNPKLPSSKILIPASISAGVILIILGFTIYNTFIVAPSAAHEIDDLKTIQKSILLKEYSDFELGLTYYLTPLKTENNTGGYPFDMLVTNKGNYDQNVTNTWWVSRICDKNNTVQELVNTKKTISSWIIKKGDDHTYFLQAYNIYPELDKVKSFELGIFVQSHPWLTTGSVNEISKARKTFIQYDYDEKAKIWMPRFNDYVLECGFKSTSYSDLTLTTNNTSQFQFFSN
ncbi:MAG: hypothetical protein ACREA7_06345 [Nitrosotalea sp.]